MSQAIIHVTDPAQARVLIAALKAHGFHPMEGGESGLPGLPGVIAPEGIAIVVPDDEAASGLVLATALLKDMTAR